MEASSACHIPASLAADSTATLMDDDDAAGAGAGAGAQGQWAEGEEAAVDAQRARYNDPLAVDAHDPRSYPWCNGGQMLLLAVHLSLRWGRESKACSSPL